MLSSSLLFPLVSLVLSIMASATSGLTYFITGCSRGIGLGLVQRILENRPHDRVIATCRDPANSDLARFSDLYPKQRFLLMPLEVSSAQSHQELLEMLTLENVDAIDVLIANAGVATPAHPDDEFFNCTPDDLEFVWKTNVLGSMLTLQTYSQHVLRSRMKLSVVVSSRLGSIAQAIPQGGYTAYRASKAALNMLAVTYAADKAVRDAGGRVLCMHPGWVQTDMGGSGGRKAPVTVEQSCAGILQVIDHAMEVQTHPSIGVSAAPGMLQKKLATENCVFVGFDGELMPW